MACRPREDRPRNKALASGRAVGQTGARHGGDVSGTNSVALSLPSGESVAIEVRRSQRARRLAIRILDSRGGVELVLPRRASLREGMRFASERAAWIEAKLVALPPRVPFADGAVVPVLGQPIVLRHRPELPGPPARLNGSLEVPGALAELPAAVRAWLIDEARHELDSRSHAMAERLARAVRRIRVGDPDSCWGSCSAAGNLSFSWRLVMAPCNVLDYVVAHEVAHLAAMHHGPAFWRAVEWLVGDPTAPRSWLRRHGSRLRRYG